MQLVLALCKTNCTCMLLQNHTQGVYNSKVQLHFGAANSKQQKKPPCIPPGQEESNCLYSRSSTPPASQCSQSKCNTGRPAGSASLSFHSLTGIPRCLGRTITMKQFQTWTTSFGMQTGCEGREPEEPVRLQQRGRVQLDLCATATHRTDEQNPQGGRTSAELQELPSSCPTRSFPQCLASSGSPPRI